MGLVLISASAQQLVDGSGMTENNATWSTPGSRVIPFEHELQATVSLTMPESDLSGMGLCGCSANHLLLVLCLAGKTCDGGEIFLITKIVQLYIKAQWIGLWY